MKIDNNNNKNNRVRFQVVRQFHVTCVRVCVYVDDRERSEKTNRKFNTSNSNEQSKCDLNPT